MLPKTLYLSKCTRLFRSRTCLQVIIHQFLRSTKLSAMLQLRSLFFFFLAYSSASPVAAPACYDDLTDLPAPAALDCAIAMINFKKDPLYTKVQTYGIYENPPRNVPIHWTYRTCMMTVTAIDASKTDTFAFSQTTPAFAAIYEICVRKKKSGQGFGGYMPIGHGQTFYAVVQYNPSYPNFASHKHSQGSSDRTDNGRILPIFQASGSANTS